MSKALQDLIANVRTSPTDDAELRESLREGWDKHLPGIKDEAGVILVGNRRNRICLELGLSPVFITVTGLDEDERLRLAAASNVGGAGMTKEDRRRLAERLFGEHGYTQQRIAAVLGVTQQQISLDLEGLQATCKPPRPKGGRPRKAPKQPRGFKEKPETDKSKISVNLQDEVFEEAKAAARGKGKTFSEHVNDLCRAAQEVDPATLSPSAQAKLAAAVRQHQRKLELEFRPRVQNEVRRRIDEIILPHWKKQIAEAKLYYDKRKGIMNRATFHLIWSALHPDSRNSITDGKLERAFTAFSILEKHLLNEKDSPTMFGELPDNLAEWDKMKAKTKMDRARRHASSASAVRRV